MISMSGDDSVTWPERELLVTQEIPGVELDAQLGRDHAHAAGVSGR